MEYETAEKEYDYSTVFFNTSKRFDRSDSVKLLLWKQHQLNRMVLDYLVRDEKYELALAFAEDLHLSDYSDLDLHVTRSKHIVDSLKKHDCTDALKWINLNRSKLVKANCLEYEKLEMELKIQEFIHLVSENQTVEAVRYSQTYLLPYAVNNDENMNRIKQAMGAIVFIHHDDSYIYKEFMGDERWINIIDLFKLVFNKLYKIPAESILSIYMKLGLSTLKSSCLAGVKNTDCPTCRTDVQNITRSLPALIHSHSTLLCPLSKKPMNDMNYPMVLPNGNVYAKDSIEDLKTEDKLTIVDPKTNNVFKVSEIRRVYIT